MFAAFRDSPAWSPIEVETLEPRLLMSAVAPDAAPIFDGVYVPQGLLAPDVNAATTSGGASGAAVSGTLHPLSAVPVLHSNPAATLHLYLDFDGQTVVNTSWNAFNSGLAIHAPAYDIDGDITTFSDQELANIQLIWAAVAEDYAPFNIDVTTVEPSAADFAAGAMAQRVLISSDVDDTRLGGDGLRWTGGAYGGLSFNGTWSGTSDTPCWVFANELANGNAKYTADSAAHEAGHTFGLDHDGTTTGGAYYAGQSTPGSVGWAPIMGVGYYQPLTQWSDGDYANANNTQDDLAIIASATNKITLRGDDYGNTLATAAALPTSSGVVSANGDITSRTDVDAFTFYTGAGLVHLHVSVAGVSPDLDVLAKLYDSTGNVIATSNDPSTLEADISLSLAAGTYYLTIDGTGCGDPLAGGYSDYASVGQYSVSGSIIAATQPAAPAAPTNLHAASSTSTSVKLAWTDQSGNESGFRIFRSTNGGETWSKIATVGANVTTFNNTGLQKGTAYAYRVCAYNTVGNSAFSNTITFKPGTGVVANSSTTSTKTLSAAQVFAPVSADPSTLSVPATLAAEPSLATQTPLAALRIDSSIEVTADALQTLKPTVAQPTFPADLQTSHRLFAAHTRRDSAAAIDDLLETIAALPIRN